VEPSLKPKPVSGFDLEALDDELVIYHPVSAAIFYCNPTAALIFRLCDGQRSVAEITELLTRAYPEARARMADDVRDTLTRLCEHGALTWS
jgi:hypothetical protein